MAAYYGNDFEDPRLSVVGFVTDYVVWRLAVDGYEWRDAPKVPAGAEEEYAKMRSVCVQIEEYGAWSWIEWTEFDILFGFYCDTMRLFAKSKTNHPKEISYEQVCHLIAVAGMLCKEKARKGKTNGMTDVVRFTVQLIDSRIRASWSDTGRSWDGFWIAFDPLINERIHLRPSIALPHFPFNPHIINSMPYQNIIFASTGVLGVVGTIIACRMFKETIATILSNHRTIFMFWTSHGR